MVALEKIMNNNISPDRFMENQGDLIVDEGTRIYPNRSESRRDSKGEKVEVVLL